MVSLTLMKAAQKAVLAVIIVFLLALAVTAIMLLRNHGEGTIANRGDCTAPSIDWMTISNNIDHQALAGLASQLAAAASADANGLKNLTNVKSNGEFKTALKDVSIEALHSQKTVNVTQEFFQNATAYRMAVCNLEREISKHIISSPKALEEAQLQLLKLSSEFAAIGQKEEQKMTVVNVQQHFDILNGAYQGKTIVIGPKQAGIYELQADILAGDCVMRKGSQLIFGSNGVAKFILFVRTKHTTNRDIWHQTWTLEDGQSFGTFD